jgi:hypothetical protein
MNISPFKSLSTSLCMYYYHLLSICMSSRPSINPFLSSKLQETHLLRKPVHPLHKLCTVAFRYASPVPLDFFFVKTREPKLVLNTCMYALLKLSFCIIEFPMENLSKPWPCLFVVQGALSEFYPLDPSSLDSLRFILHPQHGYSRKEEISQRR